jgi:hypothetical protein
MLKMGDLGLFIEKYKENGFSFLTGPRASLLARSRKPAQPSARARALAHVRRTPAS